MSLLTVTFLLRISYLDFHGMVQLGSEIFSLWPHVEEEGSYSITFIIKELHLATGNA